MTQHRPPQAMTLFDLIARTWETPVGVRSLLFNGKGTSLAAQLEDGRLAFVSLKDAESSDSRVRVEADTGLASIRPRSKPLPPPVFSEAPVARSDVAMCRLGDQGFAFAELDTGTLWRATARGQILAMNVPGPGDITALAALPGTGGVVAAHGARLTIVDEVSGAERVTVTLDHGIERIAVSPDQKLLACWGRGQMSIVDAGNMSSRAQIACEGELLWLEWSPCQHWLVAGCADKAVLLVDVMAEKADRIVNFPAPVLTAGFSEKANAVVASGAFRVVGWSLPDLPFGDHEGTPIETGKPGLTLVDRLAVHPDRAMCAASYGSGLVMLSQIGQPDEMLLRDGTGAAVNALTWSDDGAHLAIGGEDGRLSIVTFPKNMFK